MALQKEEKQILELPYKKIDSITPKENFLYDMSTLDFLPKNQ